MQTFSGIQFHPFDPEPWDFEIDDIARALSLVNRFNGHTKFPYSVAQHSLIVAANLPRTIALEGLLHDAAEAYIGDMVRAVKIGLDEYQKLEHLIETKIAERFGLIFPWPKEVKEADDRTLFTERRDCLNVQPPWPWRCEPYPEKIEPMQWFDVRCRFLEVYTLLKRP